MVTSHEDTGQGPQHSVDDALATSGEPGTRLLNSHHRWPKPRWNIKGNGTNGDTEPNLKQMDGVVGVLCTL